MSELMKITEILADVSERIASQHAEQVRLNTIISIEIPSIKEDIKAFGEAEGRITALERYGYENRQAISQIAGMQQSINDLTTKVTTMSETVEAMKPIIQFFGFVKWLAMGIALVLGWVGSNAIGLWDFIEKLFHR